MMMRRKKTGGAGGGGVRCAVLVAGSNGCGNYRHQVRFAFVALAMVGKGLLRRKFISYLDYLHRLFSRHTPREAKQIIILGFLQHTEFDRFDNDDVEPASNNEALEMDDSDFLPQKPDLDLQGVDPRKGWNFRGAHKILPKEVEAELKEAAMISMGIEVRDLDLENIKDLCSQVLSFFEYRAQLYDHSKSRMNTIAPNLTALVGELVGAPLIAHGSSLVNLAKQPESTVQILQKRFT